jgi:hypothetical protein
MLSKFKCNCLSIFKRRTGKSRGRLSSVLGVFVCVSEGADWNVVVLCRGLCIEDLSDFVGREDDGRRVDELCIGEWGGRSAREGVLVKSYVGVSKMSGEVVWSRSVANVSNRMGERGREARTPALTRRRSARKPAVGVMVSFCSPWLILPLLHGNLNGWSSEQ